MVRSRVVLILIIVMFTIRASAQVEQIWVFGTGAGLDFSTQPPGLTFSIMDSREACASVCNENGELLFYTDGSLVFDSAHNMMPNGTNLTGLGFNVTQSAVQGTLIVPFPGDPNRFYIFSMTPIELLNEAGRLYYSVVDMSLNNGYGDIVPTEKGILVDTGLTEQLTSTPAEGQCGVWIIACSRSNSDIKTYLVNQYGVHSNAITSPAPAGSGGIGGYNSIIYSLGSFSGRQKISKHPQWNRVCF